jgi:hypothetical protein
MHLAVGVICLALAELRSRLVGSGLHTEDSDESRKRLERLRASYEGYAIGLSGQLAFDLPNWRSEQVSENWRTAARRPAGERGLL